jgi:hypothetical protein
VAFVLVVDGACSVICDARVESVAADGTPTRVQHATLFGVAWVLSSVREEETGVWLCAIARAAAPDKIVLRELSMSQSSRLSADAAGNKPTGAFLVSADVCLNHVLALFLHVALQELVIAPTRRQ